MYYALLINCFEDIGDVDPNLDVDTLTLDWEAQCRGEAIDVGVINCIYEECLESSSSSQREE